MIVLIFSLLGSLTFALTPAERGALEEALRSGITVKAGTSPLIWYSAIEAKVRNEDIVIDRLAAEVRAASLANGTGAAPGPVASRPTANFFPDVYADLVWKQKMLRDMMAFCCGMRSFSASAVESEAESEERMRRAAEMEAKIEAYRERRRLERERRRDEPGRERRKNKGQGKKKGTAN